MDVRNGIFECRGVLVLHADGTLECDEGHDCGADESVHGWWVPCTEVLCGCTGDEADLVGAGALLAAA